MASSIRKTFLMLYFVIYAQATQHNKSLRHVKRSSVEDSLFKNQAHDSYRSYQPVSIKYHKASYPRADERTDYDNSYDTEYGGVVSNFTSSIYDDNPPLYPNPEEFSKNLAIKLDSKGENEVELPDDSLADADLKEHNIIDSVTYLYGFSSCHGPRNEYIILIFINTAITSLMVLGSLLWLMLSQHTAKYRQESKLYPITVNMCCSFIVCMLIYVKAVSGSSSPAVCEKIALLLHYTYLTCATWIVAMAASLTEYCSYNTIVPIKYSYLIAYGFPALLVMFNYALSMEQYEIKHYCWMSLEKGMVMGFMIPSMLLIIINTGIILHGLKAVNKKQSESLQSRLQELFEKHEAIFRKNGQVEVLTSGMKVGNRNESDEALNNIDIAGSSRKNTDSSETLDREFNGSDENCYVNIGLPNEENMDDGIDQNNSDKDSQDRGVTNGVVSGPLWMNFDWGTEGTEMKTYLNLCLVLEPFFAINWVMGVAAIENAGHWTTPTIYLILAVTMYIYFTVTICSNLPMMVFKKTVSFCCEEIVGEPIIVPIRTTDSIPLLNPAVEKTNGTPAPADTISTISI